MFKCISMFSVIFFLSFNVIGVERKNLDLDLVWNNELRPFKSDGCSSFFDGVPFFNKNLWVDCCVEHDISYWQGGNINQRIDADEKLKSCIKTKTNLNFFANMFYLGVRGGGHAGLPTSWKWGYGWKIYRGYRSLSYEEKQMVDMELEKIPEDISQIEVEFQYPVPKRDTVTGDYCLDIVINELHGLTILDIEEIKTEGSVSDEGFIKTYSIKRNGCETPYQFTFLLLRKNACKQRVNELIARGRIRLKDKNVPTDCRMP